MGAGCSTDGGAPELVDALVDEGSDEAVVVHGVLSWWLTAATIARPDQRSLTTAHQPLTTTSTGQTPLAEDARCQPSAGGPKERVRLYERDVPAYDRTTGGSGTARSSPVMTRANANEVMVTPVRVGRPGYSRAGSGMRSPLASTDATRSGQDASVEGGGCGGAA